MKKLVCSLGIAAALCMVAAPAMAATEWNFGASLRFATFWTERDHGKTKINDWESGGKSLDNDGKLEFLQQRNSRIRMLMKSDNLSGYIELGYNPDTGAVTPRDYFGTYHFNPEFSVTIGQHLQLFDTLGLSSQVWGNDLNMHGIGVSWNPSDPKIFFTYKGFQFGFSIPYTTESTLKSQFGTATAATYTADFNTYLPQLQFAYRYKGDSWRMLIGGGFQTYNIKDITNKATLATVSSKNVNSWLLTADASGNFGALFLGGSVSVGQNWSEACWNTRKGGLANDYTNAKRLDNFGAAFDGKKIKNTTSAMAAIVVGYRLTESLRLEAGAGYRYDENDTWEKDSHMWTAYLQASYTVAPGFRITPEIGYVNLGDTVGTKGDKSSAIDNGYIWYVGAQWRMDF